MQVGEAIFTATDDGGIDDAVSNHLHGGVNRYQRGRAGGGDSKTGPHKSIPVADEACRGAVESTQESGVIRGYASRLHLPFDCALLLRRELDGPFDSGKDVVG